MKFRGICDPRLSLSVPALPWDMIQIITIEAVLSRDSNFSAMILCRLLILSHFVSVASKPMSERELWRFEASSSAPLRSSVL